MTLISCDDTGNKDLLNRNRWDTSGNVTIQDSTLILKGEQTRAFLKKGNYKNFELSMELRTTPGSKGFIGFHSDSDGKGYRVAINNDRDDRIWWKMTESLLSVRNLTKSSVKENEWFGMNIRVEGHAITVSINDEPVVEYIEPENPLFLPEAMSDRYDEFRTEERMDKVIDALAKSGKALEINELYQIPNKALIMKAKNAGVKFTFGTNNVSPEVRTSGIFNPDEKRMRIDTTGYVQTEN
ncbi:MAG: DUF1080 domain-containing protein [Tannerella sp.]|jgi:hypothetical protein|nr:DUF1080 domain-containing protein [Tannerella sp.]